MVSLLVDKAVTDFEVNGAVVLTLGLLNQASKNPAGGVQFVVGSCARMHRQAVASTAFFLFG